MKNILWFLLIPLLLFGQAEYNPKTGTPFTSADTLFEADTLTSGWHYIGGHVGSVTFGLLFDALGDSTKGVNLLTQVKMEGFDVNGGFADSVLATYGDSTGWMLLAEIDSVVIADSLGYYYPLSDESWWNWIDWIRFRIISPATIDSIAVSLSKLRGQ